MPITSVKPVELSITHRILVMFQGVNAYPVNIMRYTRLSMILGVPDKKR